MIAPIFSKEQERLEFALAGKPCPIKASRVTPNLEGMRIQKESYIYSYPKTIKTDGQRLKYLKDLYLRNDIGDKIFIDLSKMLAVKAKFEELKKLKEQKYCPFIDILREI